MPTPTVITDLDPVAANNFPSGSNAPSVLDDVQRAHGAFIRQLLNATQSNAYTAFTTAGTSTAYTLTPSPAITAYAAGQSFYVTFNAASGAAPTLAISGIATPPNLVKQNADGTYSNIAANDIPINHRSRVTLLSATQALVGLPPIGKRLAQIVTSATGAVATGVTATPYDDTIPQITEGDQYLSVVITPQNAASTLVISGQACISSSLQDRPVLALHQDAIANALIAIESQMPSAGFSNPIPFRHEMTSGSTSAITFRVRVGSVAGATLTLNGTGGVRKFGGTQNSFITVEEYLP